jgi:hypothetical protein
MNTSNSLLSPVAALNEQIARQIFDLLPERGPLMIIMDREGHCWPSDSEQFSKLNISKAFLKELCDKIDDGTEPIVTQANDCSVVAAQLATEHTNCGYVLLAMPQYSPGATLANIDLVEIVLGQISLIAKLIEKNNLLYELQMKQLSVYNSSETPSN